MAALAIAVHAKMFPTQPLGLMTLQDKLARLPSVLDIGTACSGTDLVVGVLNTLSAFWRQSGVAPTFRHRFSCDSKEASRAFIRSQWKPEVSDAMCLTCCSGVQVSISFSHVEPDHGFQYHTARLSERPATFEVHLAGGGYASDDFRMLGSQLWGAQGAYSQPRPR